MSDTPDRDATAVSAAVYVAGVYEEVLADLGRGLHDRPLQALSGALLVLELLEPSAPEQYRSLLQPAVDAVEQSLVWMRATQPAVVPPPVDQDVAETLRETFTEPAAVTADHSVSGVRLDPVWAPLVMRILTIATGPEPAQRGDESAVALAVHDDHLLASFSAPGAESEPVGFGRALTLTRALGGNGSVQHRSRWSLLLQIPLSAAAAAGGST
jgi:hypothetical protein